MTAPQAPWPTPEDRPMPTAPVYQVPSGPFVHQPHAATNGLAIASLICALGGFITTISFPLGAVLGHIALRQIRERGEAGEGFAKAGIIVGWIGTGLLVIGCIAFVLLVRSLNNAGY